MKTFWRSLLTALKITLIILIVVAVAGAGVLAWLSFQVGGSENSPLLSAMEGLLPTRATEPTEPIINFTEPETEPTPPPTTLPPEPDPEHVVSRATIAATGDMLMHKPVFDTALQSDGSYNFDYIFNYLSEYSHAADYAIANLETTLCGTTNGYPYKGYPQFNCPDEIVDGLRDAGFDMLLTANNHSYDTGQVGYFRTIETVRGKGLQTLGTMLNAEEPKYAIQDINGIRVGMVCYTYEGRPEGAMADRVYLNGIPMHQGGEAVINAFRPANPEPFYTEVAGYLDEMKAQGAEATVLFIHWGVEYTTTPVAHQTQIAQKLCDLGFDVIVGGHPHVVEPIQLLTSTVDPAHKTVCLYSMGNAVSNQRANILTSHPSGHTEDGVWFTMTFSKYSDGTVYLEDVDLIPCWVDLRTTNGRKYFILPLDGSRMDQWQELLELSDVGLGAAKRSYERTMAIVGTGLTESRNYLAQQKEAREADYLAEAVQRLYAA